MKYKIKILYYIMSFASTRNVIQVHQYNLSQTNLPGNIVHTMFQEVLPKGIYFLSYSPYMLTTNQANQFSSVTCWIGSSFQSTGEVICSSIVVAPYNYANMGYVTPSMSGVFLSDGINPLVIRLSASVTNSGTYNAYVITTGSYDFNYIRLS